MFVFITFSTCFCVQMLVSLFLIDWIDSGNFAAFTVIGVGVNVTVQFNCQSVNGTAALVLVQTVIFSQHVVGNVLKIFLVKN